MASIRTAGLAKNFGDLRAVNEIDLDPLVATTTPRARLVDPVGHHVSVRMVLAARRCYSPGSSHQARLSTFHHT
jgi:hypothetical protein